MSIVSVPSDLRSDSAKTERLVKQSLRPSDFPSTFRANTSEEETILQYTENFRRQYVNLFPHRAPLLLRPQNECSIAKLVCTYIRPFQLSAMDSYDLEKCAKFVAEFVEYLPLKSPSKLPSALHSPYTVVQLRAGDCFDMATLLTSLLRGNGYDAYVVSGYAPRWITERDLTEQDVDLSGTERPDNQVLFGNPKYQTTQAAAQTQQAPSLLLEQKSKEMEMKKPSGEDSQWPRDTETGGIHSRAFGKYVIKFPTVHVSKFLEQQKAGKQGSADGGADETNKDPFHRRRVHAWVLVLPNRRPESVKEPMFVEPSTGALYPAADLNCPYERIESVWSDRNLWVNLQSDKTPIQKLNYQLANPNAWEFLFFSRNASSEIEVFNTAAIAAANAAALAERNARLADDSHQDGDLISDDAANGNTGNSGDKAEAVGADGQSSAESKDGSKAPAAPSDDDSADALRDAPEAVVAATGDGEANKESAVVAGSDGEQNAASTNAEESSTQVPESTENRPGSLGVKPVAENSCGVSRVDGWRAKPPTPHQVDASALQRVSGMKLQVLEPPMSWVATIPITKEAAAVRLPNGRRVERYKRCKVEYFADFFDGHFSEKAPLTHRDLAVSACSKVASVSKMAEVLRANGVEPSSEESHSEAKGPGAEVAQYVGLKKRVVLYEDDQCANVRETQETFAHRKDKLVYRIRIPSQSLVHQVYEQGRARGLKSYTEVAGTRRCFEFYPLARVDGMVKREEILGVKIVEMYQDRDDRLLYRSVAFDTAPGSPKRAKGFCVAVGPEQTELPVRKITEKFSRNEAVHAEEDVRKRTHFILEGQIRLDFHYGQHQVSSSQLLFDKATESCHGHRMDPLWKAPTPSQIREQLQQLLFVEKALMGKVKDRERDMLELMQQLMKDASHASLSKSIYHRAWEESLKAQKGGTDSAPASARLDEDAEDNDKAADTPASPLMGRALAARGSVSTENGVLYQDYLAPFLAQFPAGKPLSRKQALQVKEECLRALKERLLERANIIQAHLDSEQEQLRQRQAQHERTVAALSAAAQAQGNNAPDNPHTQALAVENAEFSHFSDDAMFRINILQARLSRHEEQSLQKYAQLDARLWADPRLRLSDSKP